MRKVINKKVCDTETAKQLGVIYAGEFGDAGGYEEALYINKSKQHFIYGNGGSESKYTRPTIDLFTEEEAENWLKANKKEYVKDDAKITESEKPTKKMPAAPKKEKTRAKPRTYTEADKAFIADKNNSIESVMEKFGYDKTAAHKMRAYFKKRLRAAED